MIRTQESFEQGLLRLLNNNIHSGNLFLMASRTAEMPELSQWFTQGAAQCAVFLKETETWMCPGPSKTTGVDAPDGLISDLWTDHGEVFGADGDHVLFEQAIGSEKQALGDYVRILGAKGIPGPLAEVLNDQMTQIGVGLSKLNYLDALKYESE